MKKGLKRKAGESIGNWILRTAEKTKMTEEQANLLIAVYKETYDEGIAVGEEIAKIKNIKNYESKS